MIGLFINTLPVRVRIDPEERVLPWLKRLQDQLVELRHYEHSPLIRIQGWSDVPRGAPLFESLFVFENYPVDRTLGQRIGSVQVTDVRLLERTNHQLGVLVLPGPSLTVRVGYDRLRFEDAAIARALRHFKTLLEGIGQDPHRCLGELPMLGQEELRQVLAAWAVGEERGDSRPGVSTFPTESQGDSEMEETIL
jgi:non-ribosomal peptide synthetase component F